MKMDPTTETIAHFIGLFELKIEEFRLRQDYLEFSLRKTEQDLAPIQTVDVRLNAPHDLSLYKPGLHLPPALSSDMTAEPASAVAQSADGPKDFPKDLLLPKHTAPEFADSKQFDGSAINSTHISSSFAFATPGSLAAVTVQTISLTDDDLFLSGLDINFVDPEVLHAELQELVAEAQALVGFAVPTLPSDGDWMAFAQDMISAIDASVTQDRSSEVATFRGGEASDGVFVDGVAVAEAPVWTELLPAFLRSEESTAEESFAEDTSPGVHDFGLDFGGDSDLPGTPIVGHTVVSGANLAINEVAHASKWLDSSVYVVLGDVARVDAISQVNAIVEHDTIDGAPQSQPSLTKNVATVSTVSAEAPMGPVQGAGAPAAWSLSRVEADLIHVNWVKQVTFVTDFDRAEVMFSSSSIFLGLGENEMVNSAVLNDFGNTFDLTFVSGDMIDATIISQKNVLLDSDHVTTVYPKMAVGGTPPVPNQHHVRQPETEDDVRETEAADSQAKDSSPDIVDLPEQVTGNVGDLDTGMLPDPTVARPEEGKLQAETSVQPGLDSAATPVLSLSDNLLLNEATIQRNGADSQVEMKDSFRDAAEKLRDGAETIAREVAEDALFLGRDALRILQIDGDLVRINLFEQINIVGDADQIHLEMARLKEEMGAQAELVAGSNALINRATIREDGIDSQIMAAQNVYTDALIHQAGLFDADAVPTGVRLSNLTNDAVAAFIAQGDAGQTHTTEHISATGSYEDYSNDDVMQTVLA